jgi:multidrug efflux pump subunit AcrA (membrane-fusion protein)
MRIMKAITGAALFAFLAGGCGHDGAPRHAEAPPVRVRTMAVSETAAAGPVDGVGTIRAREIREGLRRLQEHNLVDRYLQL